MKPLLKVLTVSVALLSISTAPLSTLPIKAEVLLSQQEQGLTASEQDPSFTDTQQDNALTDNQQVTIEDQQNQDLTDGQQDQELIDPAQGDAPTEDQQGQVITKNEPKQNIAPAAKIQLTGNDQFQFNRDSNVFYVNGVAVNANEKVEVIKGTTYVQFRSIATAFGFKVGYDSTAKESIATKGSLTIAFKQTESTMKVNGTAKNAGAEIISRNGNLMIPIRAWANATGSQLKVNGTQLNLSWNIAPKANFSIDQSKIIAGETFITVSDHSTASFENSIEEEKWEGLEDIYYEPGEYTITRYVRDSSGFWSEPYSVTIKVERPNEPPVADFTTNKVRYRIGEPVYYTNRSYDDDKIISNTWTGNDRAFFKPGTYTIKLEVQDSDKVTTSVEKQITVIDEVMYTEEQFYLNFSEPGDKIPVNPGLSLTLPSYKYGIQSEDITTVRTNSPEQITEAAIDYTDTITGAVRFNIHKQNISDRPLELHLVATNDTASPTKITKNHYSYAGPATYVSQAGKTAAMRYLEELLTPVQPEEITLQPGESIELLVGLPAITAGKTMTVFSEYYSASPIRYNLVVTEKNGSGIEGLTTLQQSAHDGKHIRGTFAGGDREIIVNDVLGYKAEKLVLGDKPQDFDKLLVGVDAITGQEVINYGNGGTVYHLNLRVAPNTAILLNPRGGHYGGAIIVNDQLVPITKNSILSGQSEAAFLHRTGKYRETVSFSYVVAPGSNMPLHMMFVPVPSLDASDEQATNNEQVQEQQ